MILCKTVCYFRLLLIFICITFSKVNAQPFDAVVNSTKTNITVDKGKLTEKYSIDITINNRRGETYTEFEVYYSKNDKIKKLEAWIEDAFGNIVRKLGSKEIITVSAVSDGALYEDVFIQHFILRHNSYPYKIHFEYTRENDQYLHIAEWSPVYENKIPTKDAQLIVDVPVNFEINYKEVNVSPANISKSDNRIIYSWQSNYPEPYDDEIFSPPLETIVPRVSIVPKYFNYGIPGSFESWQSYGEWQTKLMDGLQELPLKEQFEIDKIKKSTQDTKEIIKLIYQYLQDNTRYINVSIDIGGMKPYPATYVAYNKYGDCKALTNYTIALLKHAGIKGYYAKVKSGIDIINIDKSFPSQQSDHIILFIPLENDSIWLDCTSKTNPVNYLGTFSQGRDALIVDGNNSRFVKTPTLTESDVESISNYTILLDPLSSSKIEIKENLRGLYYEIAEFFSKNIDTKKQEEYIHESIDLADFILTDWSIVKPDRDSATLSVEMKLSSSSVIKKFGNDYVVKPIPQDIPDFEPVLKRKLDVVISYPVSTIDTLKYIYPNNLKIASAPEPVLLESKYGKYQTRVIQKDNTIEIIRKFSFFPGRYPVSEYAEFYSFIQNIKNAENKNVILLN